MGWTNESVEMLRKLWAKGLTANEIAKELGVTKNAIVGKVHRLCLKARPSPIKFKNTEDTTAEEQVFQNAEEEVVLNETEDVLVIEEKPTNPKDKKTPKTNITLTELDSHTCRWPIGDPRDEDFCFCGKKVRSGQTYCDEHSLMAYVKATRK